MASSSSFSPSAPASSSKSWSHDVFLSFRGKDTRKAFVDHLYSALVRQGIDTYKDDESSRPGESIHPSLMKAIEGSQTAVVVFSKNYAESSWCLDELAHIMKCKDTTGQIVMPIFYDVDPSTVRKQKGKFGKAFTRLKLKNKNKFESWKKALVDASNLTGWEPKNIANGHESKVIKEIVDKISLMLKPVTSSANQKLVGIKDRAQLVKSKLQLGSDGVRMIGIWGVGGGGKTTLASFIYDEISSKFDGCCFIANIREESRRCGLEELQEKFLLKMEANSVRRGRCSMQKRFRNRKVLIVLDDVDQLDQLEALAGSPDWFGEGSRIIITTRDEHLLEAHKVVVHNVILLNSDEAIELFHKHAPQGSIPMQDYEQLSKEVVCYAGGLPLALTILGSFLCDKNIQQWRSALARLKEIPDTNILEKLKISFDGLEKVQKDLFLDIACFFRWWKKDRAVEILDACGFHPVIGVEVLRQKALITISDGRFDMHDQAEELGHYIVRGKHPKNPEKHSRVWKKKDVLTICAMDATMELDKIEAIQIDYSSFGVHEEPPPIVANMRSLRYIKWKGDPANPLHNKIPPKELCCLILHTTDPLLNKFPPKELRCLILHTGLQSQLWNGYKCLPNLKILELWYLDNLIMTPNFDGLPNLERFILKRSPHLKEIHSSFGGLDRLVCLSIIECKCIMKFPPITRLKKLETLSFARCPSLFELSKIQQKMDSLGDHEDMSSAVLELSNLSHIRLCFSRKHLRKLDLRGCNLGDEDISSAVWELPNLQELDLSNNKFSRLNFGIMRIPRLKLLNVSQCTSLVEFSELPSSIAILKANNCSSLETFGDISNCKWLWKVSFRGANKLGPPNGYILLDSMLKVNAIKYHRMSVTLQHPIPNRIVGRLFRGNIFTLHLPCDWYNDFCGLLIHTVTFKEFPEISIIIKQEADEDSRFELWRESNEEQEREYDGRNTYVGYVSFNSLRGTGCLNSTYNVISIYLFQHGFPFGAADRIGAALVHRKSTDDPVQTTKAATDCSEFWDEDHFRPTFTIEPDSKSFIKIVWRPNNQIIHQTNSDK